MNFVEKLVWNLINSTDVSQIQTGSWLHSLKDLPPTSENFSNHMDACIRRVESFIEAHMHKNEQ